jgi:hypothetical protein
MQPVALAPLLTFLEVSSRPTCPWNSRRSSKRVINIKTAKALGLTITPSVRVDELIQ